MEESTGSDKGSEQIDLLRVKFNRTTFKKQTSAQAAEQQPTDYKVLIDERGASFRYLMEVNYGFLGMPRSRFDRTIFSKRSGGLEKLKLDY